jgi:hypothetical protein
VELSTQEYLSAIQRSCKLLFLGFGYTADITTIQGGGSDCYSASVAHHFHVYGRQGMRRVYLGRIRRLQAASSR